MPCDNWALRGSTVQPLNRQKPSRLNGLAFRRIKAFALYEVLLGVTIFALGVIAVGKATQNCLNASAIAAEENAVRQVLSDRMAEIQAAQGAPDAEKEFTIDSNYGPIKVTQKSAPAGLTEPDDTVVNGIILVTLQAQWQQGGSAQSKALQFYVYRPGQG